MKFFKKNQSKKPPVGAKNNPEEEEIPYEDRFERARQKIEELFRTDELVKEEDPDPYPEWHITQEEFDKKMINKEPFILK